jgi:hypothetical protein
LTQLPLREPLVTPTPEQMLGFPTFEEAYEAQQVCLNEPMPKVQRFLLSLSADVKSGRIRVIQPKHPQPPTSGPTMWTDSAEMHGTIQDFHVKKTSN